MIPLAKLLLAHLAGDFILQPKSWVADKEQRKLRSSFLYIHAAIHFLLIVILTWHVDMLMPALIISGSHLIIDAIKVVHQQPTTRTPWFLADQCLHIVIIGVVCHFQYHIIPIEVMFIHSHKFWLIITGITLITLPSSIIVKMLISQWTPRSENGCSAESLPEAGKFIGILERLFILLFIGTNHWEAVGFLLAAKSVFRFGDLKEAHDRKLTEYVLIGTLLSFAIATATGLVVFALLG